MEDVWDKGMEILEKVAEALDCWCWEITWDTALDCYRNHQLQDFYEMAVEFVNWSSFGITKEDIEFLEELPEEIYERLNAELQDRIERVVRELEKEVISDE